MTDIRLEKLRKEFNRGEVVAVKDLDFVFPSGTTTCLLGPSGCGKTTLMRIIAGLETPTSGEIFFGDKRVTNLSTRKRQLGMIFQYPVFYRGLTVRANVELPLKDTKLTQAERKKRVDEILELLEMSDAADSNLGEIHGGTRQKVAVAREVARQTDIILFDEPITNVGISTKLQLKRALKALFTRLNQTIIYVTHDQTEAMTLADRIALMKDGEIMQYDAPRELYTKPDSEFGGWFLGNPGMNFFKELLADVEDAQRVELPLFPEPVALSNSSDSWRKLTLGIRPEDIQVYDTPVDGAVQCIVTTKNIVTGGQYLLNLTIDDLSFKAKISSKLGPKLQTAAWVKFPVQYIRVFDADGFVVETRLQQPSGSMAV